MIEAQIVNQTTEQQDLHANAKDISLKSYKYVKDTLYS